MNFFVYRVKVEESQPASKTNLKNIVPTFAFGKAEFDTMPVHIAKKRKVVENH
jgi:hypothetical protein